jgi:hypothetical protein
LDALAEADEGAVGRVFTQFLWNWAAFLGLRPDLGEAGRPCEALSDGLLWFDRLDGGFTPAVPAGEDSVGLAGRGGPGAGGSRFVALGPGARRWLLAVQDLAPAQVVRVSADPLSLAQARAVAAALMTEIVGRELSTWHF